MPNIIPLEAFADVCRGRLERVRREWPNGIPVCRSALDRALAMNLDMGWAGMILLRGTRQRIAFARIWERCHQTTRQKPKSRPRPRTSQERRERRRQDRKEKLAARQRARANNRTCGEALLRLLIEMDYGRKD